MDIKQFEIQITSYVNEIYEQIRKTLEEDLFSAKEIEKFIIKRKKHIANSIYDKLVKQFDENLDDPLKKIKKEFNNIHEDLIKEILDYSGKVYTKVSTNNKNIKQFKGKKISLLLYNQNFKHLKSLASNLQLLQTKLQNLEIVSDDNEDLEEHKEIKKKTKSSISNSEINFSISPTMSNNTFTPIPLVKTMRIDRSSIIKKIKSFNKLTDKKTEYLYMQIKILKKISKKKGLYINNHLSKIKRFYNGLSNLQKGSSVTAFLGNVIEYKMKMNIAKVVKGLLNKVKMFNKFFTWIDRMKRIAIVALRKGKSTKGIFKIIYKYKKFKSETALIIKTSIKNLKGVRFILKQYDKILKFKTNAIKLFKKPFGFIAGKIGAIGGKLSTKLLGKGTLNIVGKFFGRFGKAFGKIPVLGGVIDAWFAYDRYKKGDYVGAVLQLIAGLGKFAAPIPVVGQILYALSWLIDLGLLSLDASGMTAAESATIMGNKYFKGIIQAWISGKYGEVAKLAMIGAWNMTGDGVSNPNNPAYQSYLYWDQKGNEFNAWYMGKFYQFMDDIASVYTPMWNIWSKFVVSVSDSAFKLGKDFAAAAKRCAEKAIKKITESGKKYANDIKIVYYDLANKIIAMKDHTKNYYNKIGEWQDNNNEKLSHAADDIKKTITTYWINALSLAEKKDQQYIVKTNKLIIIHADDNKSIDNQSTNAIVQNTIKNNTFKTENSEMILREIKEQEIDYNEQVEKDYNYFQSNIGKNNVIENIIEDKFIVPPSFLEQMETLQIKLKYLSKIIKTTN